MNIFLHLIAWCIATFLACLWAAWEYRSGHEAGYDEGWDDCYDAYFPDIEGNRILSLDKPGTSFHTEAPKPA